MSWMTIIGSLLLVSRWLVFHTAAQKPSCQRFSLPEQYTASTNSTYNPAAVWAEKRWWAFANHDVCHFRNCGWGGRRTQPLGMYLGNGTGPDIAMPRITAHPWTVVIKPRQWVWGCNYTTSMLEEGCRGTKDILVVTEDYRPFVHKGEVWVSMTVHPTKLNSTAEYRAMQAVARANFDTRQLLVQYVFVRTLNAEEVRKGQLLAWNWEKNWGFFEHEGRMYILYSVLPCVVVFQLDLDGSHGFGYRFVHGQCYVRDGGKAMAALSAAHLPSFASRISGHPQLWQGVLYAMVHTVSKPKDASFADVKNYHHFLIKIDTNTWQATHVSQAPVLSSHNFDIQGAFPGALTVGSFHIVQEGTRVFVRVLIGEGDKYSCKESVLLDDVQWQALDVGNWADKLSPKDIVWEYNGA